MARDAPQAPPFTPTIKVATTIEAVPAAVWDACAMHPAATPALARCSVDTSEDPRNPFVSHAFLHAMEASGSATKRTGWAPIHVTVEDATGTIVAAAPCYLKSHSRGEYVFDQGWADAYERAGGSYYPKLQVSVPFTPATGPRLLVRPGPQAAQARSALIKGLQALMQQTGASSTHVTFLPKDEWEELGAAGFLRRQDQQFHWLNEGYESFDAFLEALASRKRKAIRRERRDAVAAGIDIEQLTGAAISEAHWDAFFAFYQDTGSRKWGRPYLTRAFFSQISASMADQVLLVMAKRAGRYIAGAINFIGANVLYGRHWGCVEQHPFLHFEVCYYQAIDFAIRRGLARVEAGAQGEHKLARGYRPVMTYSAHDIADPSLRRAVADYLKRETAYVDAVQGELEGMTPFRHTDAEEE
jgi:predicted N-acyltransferase